MMVATPDETETPLILALIVAKQWKVAGLMAKGGAEMEGMWELEVEKAGREKAREIEEVGAQDL